MLLGHVIASAEVLHEAISAGRIGIRGAPWGSGPVPRLRGQLAALLVTSDVRPGLFADPVPLPGRRNPHPCDPHHPLPHIRGNAGP